MTKYDEIVFDEEGHPLCPECLEKGIKSYMTKRGAGISGRKEYQSYRCSNRKCLRTWLNTKELFIRKE